MKIIAAFVLNLAISGIALSKDSYATVGAGTVSCGEFIQHQNDKGTESIFISWLQGFLSGINISESRRTNRFLILPNAETILLYINKFCKDNPLEQPIAGAMSLYAELMERDKATRPSPGVGKH